MSFPIFKYNHNWQYNGAAPFIDIVTWCTQMFGHCGSSGSWDHVWETIYFVEDADYALFLLRWA